MIRLTKPSIEAEDIEAVREVLETGFLVQGARVESFENKIAAYNGTNYAVAVGNCTQALHLALLSLNVEAGDLVLVPAYSWIATANVVELCGAQPLFIDIEPDTFTMNPVLLRENLKKLTSISATARRIKAILPVHAFGLMADMPAIMEIANEYGIPVVEDAACALGAEINGRKAGAWGVMGCFSFHPRKAVTTGEGGMVILNNPQFAARLRSLRNHGIEQGDPSVDFIEPGFNYRMTEFQAALGITQMEKLERIIRARQEAALRYNSLFKGSPIAPPFVPSHSRHIYQSYVALLPPPLAARDELIQRLKENGIETSIGTRHMPLSKYYRVRYNYNLGDFPVTDDVYARSLTLPLYEGITFEQQSKAVDALLGFAGLSRKGAA